MRLLKEISMHIIYLFWCIESTGGITDIVTRGNVQVETVNVQYVILHMKLAIAFCNTACQYESYVWCWSIRGSLRLFDFFVCVDIGVYDFDILLRITNNRYYYYQHCNNLWSCNVWLYISWLKSRWRHSMSKQGKAASRHLFVWPNSSTTEPRRWQKLPQ